MQLGKLTGKALTPHTLLIPILHPEWLLSSPQSYKSDGAWEEEED